MRKKKISFSLDELEEANVGYGKKLPRYQKIIMEELRTEDDVTITGLMKKYNIPERSIGNNMDMLLRNGILEDRWEWRKAEDGIRRHYHVFTLKK